MVDWEYFHNKLTDAFKVVAFFGTLSVVIGSTGAFNKEGGALNDSAAKPAKILVDNTSAKPRL